MSRRHHRWMLLGLLALASACGSTPRQARTCQADPECPSGAYCVGGACVAGMLPEAHIQIAGAAGQLISHRQVVFDGSGSVDPNPQHRLTTYRWALRGASASACAPSPASGSAQQLATVFRCAGDYHVELSVQNSLGLESAPITQAVAVGPSANAPLIDAQSPDLVLDHRCSGMPSACVATGEGGLEQFPVSVSAHDVEDGEALAYRWEVDAPAGADPASVSFQPDARSRNPLVRIASTGGTISGDWTLRAHVVDGDGLDTPAEIKLSVRNTAPALVSSVERLGFDHAYEGKLFKIKDGLVTLSGADPDGDAVHLASVRLIESAPTECLFTYLETPTTAGTFDLGIDLACPTAAELSPRIGGQPAGAGVERQLEVTARDGQGASFTLTVPLDVYDRPPTLAQLSTATTHTTDACALPGGRCFVATGVPPAGFDPDGDPVTVTALMASGVDANVASWTSAGSTGFTLLTSTAYPGMFRGADGLSPVTVTATLSDPWQPGTATFRLAIPNSPPRLVPVVGTALVGYDGARYLAEAAVAVAVDDDGDPVVSASGSGDGLCNAFTATGGEVHAICSQGFDWRGGGAPLAGDFSGFGYDVRVSASDPWATASTIASRVTITDATAPVVNVQNTYSAGRCACGVEGYWYTPAGGSCRSVDVGALVRDGGTPVHVVVQSGAGRQEANCWGGQCTASLTTSACGLVTVEVTDGARAASGYFTNALGTCSTEGELCRAPTCGPGTGKVCL